MVSTCLRAHCNAGTNHADEKGVLIAKKQSQVQQFKQEQEPVLIDRNDTHLKKNKDKTIYSVVGGGDTVALINQINAIKDFNFVSTAGGAFLEYLEGKELPGIKALK